LANQRRSFRRTAPRRATTWVGFGLNIGSATAATGPHFLEIATQTVLEQFPNPTLVRQRGEGLVYLNAGGATLDSILSMGMYFADARSLTTATVQRPGTDSASDWLWYQGAPLSDNSGTLDQNRPTVSAMRFVIDGKAMRRADSNQSLIFVAEVVDFGATPANIKISVCGRLLFKK